jgi:hypothetical protein
MEISMIAHLVVLAVTASWLGGGDGQEKLAAHEMERLKVPAKLIPKNAKPLFLLRAEGEQIYKVDKKDGKLQWVWQAPDAILLEYESGKKAGTHTKGPNGPVWEGSTGSKVEGKVIDSAKPHNATAVDWLLLKAKGDGGDGRFGKVAYIVRMDTWGGRPPEGVPMKVGAGAKVRYQATYVFFGK